MFPNNPNLIPFFNDGRRSQEDLDEFTTLPTTEGMADVEYGSHGVANRVDPPPRLFARLTGRHPTLPLYSWKVVRTPPADVVTYPELLTTTYDTSGGAPLDVTRGWIEYDEGVMRGSWELNDDPDIQVFEPDQVPDLGFGPAREGNNNMSVPTGEDTGAQVELIFEDGVWIFFYESISGSQSGNIDWTDLIVDIHNIGTGTGTGTSIGDIWGLIFNLFSSWLINITNGYQVVVNGPGTWVFNSPLSVCGPLGYCYYDVFLEDDVDNWEIPVEADAVIIRIEPGGADRTISGMIPAFDGQFVVLMNVGSSDVKITVLDNSAGSDAENRFILPGDVVIRPDEAEPFWYSPNTGELGDGRWRWWDRDAMTFRKNSGGSEYVRRRLNLIEGSNVTITMADDSVNNELDVTIAASSTGVTLETEEGGDLTITVDDTWQDSANDLTLAAGTYLLWAEGTGRATVSVGGPGTIRMRIRDITNGVTVGVVRDVARSQVDTYQDMGFGRVSTKLITVGATLLRVQGFRTSGPTWTQSTVDDIVIGALKIA